MSKLFWAMLSFISRLPVPARWSQGLDFEHYSRGIVMFPLIGVVLGGLTGLVFMALQPWCGVPLAALFAALHVPGVRRVELLSPPDDVRCSLMEYPLCNRVQVERDA